MSVLTPAMANAVGTALLMVSAVHPESQERVYLVDLVTPAHAPAHLACLRPLANHVARLAVTNNQNEIDKITDTLVSPLAWPVVQTALNKRVSQAKPVEAQANRAALIALTQYEAVLTQAGNQ